jgi:uncharacterized phage protein (TIGR02218 family)
MTESWIRERLSRQSAATAHALRITCRDGFEIGLTDHDRDMAFGGTVFRASPGMTLGELHLSADLAPDHALIATGLHPEGFTAADLDRGRFAQADAEIWRADTENVDARMLLAAGTLGQVERRGDRVVSEFRSLVHRLSTMLGRTYQKSCDAFLGDNRCGVALTGSLRSDGMAVSLDGLRIRFTAASGGAGEIFNGGTLTVTEGPLAGMKGAIRAASHTTDGAMILEPWQPLPRRLELPVAARLTAGCDKSYETCRDRFANVVNFRGFPEIPGLDVLAVATGEDE